MKKDLVKQQFGDKAQAYATSKVHANGASLQRLVELVQPQVDWRALDVATAAGHTAHIFAPHVAHVVASDLTPEMLPKAAALAAEKGLPNVSTKVADAEDLPFEDRSFNLVSCRIAPHHFPNIGQFVAEAARVLKSGGILAVVDNIVPHTGSKKKKVREAYAAAADYLNAFETLRDPSHNRMISLKEWSDLFEKNGLTVQHAETMSKEMDFHPWADRMQVSPENKVRLEVMLRQAPNIVKEFLTPEFSSAKITFRLTEGLIIGQQL
ncbi:MAG: class I SAM-dependent methyltransferase [Ardenticatenaceae bacterium]|nr:class I SAM-dependent methyltransferase [Ardenticatenaceae bacterium]